MKIQKNIVILFVLLLGVYTPNRTSDATGNPFNGFPGYSLNDVTDGTTSQTANNATASETMPVFITMARILPMHF